jgi:hypothetical protein
MADSRVGIQRLNIDRYVGDSLCAVVQISGTRTMTKVTPGVRLRVPDWTHSARGRD